MITLFNIYQEYESKYRHYCPSVLEVEDRRPGVQEATPSRRSPHSALEQNLSEFGLLKDKSRIVSRLLE